MKRTSVFSLASNSNKIFGGTWGIHQSTDNGETWSQNIVNDHRVTIVSCKDNRVLTSLNGYRSPGLYESTDNGDTYNYISFDHMISSFDFNNENIMIGSGTNFFKTSDGGITWEQSIFLDNIGTIRSVLMKDNYVFVGSYHEGSVGGVYKSSDNGNTFEQTSLSNVTVNSIIHYNGEVFAGSNNGIYRSSDNGETWQNILASSGVDQVIASNNILYACAGNSLYISSNGGSSWNQKILNNQLIYCLTVQKEKIFVGTYQNGILYSTNDGSSWNQAEQPPMPIYALDYLNNSLNVGVGFGAYRSTNQGINWIQTHDFNTFLSFTSYENYIFAGTEAGVYRSDSKGQNWGWGIGLVLLNVNALTSSQGFIQAGTSGHGVYRVPYNNILWSLTDLEDKDIRSLQSKNNTVFAGTKNEGVFVSTNNGLNWSQTTLNLQTVNSLLLKGDTVFAGTENNGVYISYDAGGSWFQSPLNSSSIFCLANYHNHILAGSDGENNFFISSDGGETWELYDSELPKTKVNAITIDNNHIWVGTDDHNLYKLALSEIININPISSEIPNSFALKQNYPNPFNPSTKIRFDIPHSKSVKLAVFNSLGQQVAVLVNEQLQPGFYEYDFNASDYSSGIYFYRLDAEGFTETKRMVLVK